MRTPSMRRIAVVDRDEAAGQALSFFLSTAGCEIRLFSDLIALKDDPWSACSAIAILDLGISNNAELQMLTEFRSLRADMALILMSSDGGFPQSMSPITAGAIAVFDKPFDANELLSFIPGI